LKKINSNEEEKENEILNSFSKKQKRMAKPKNGDYHLPK